MSKTISRITALLVAALLAVGMLSTTAFADNTSLPPAKGSLTIHKYLMDDLTQADPPNDGTETDVPDEAKPLDGITFKLYKISLPGTTAASPVDGVYTLDSMTAPSALTDEDGNVFSVSAASSVTTANGGVATASNLDQGLYLVVEEANDDVTSPAAPFVVPVPMTNAAGDGWITDVHVYPKNEDLSVDKTPDKTSVELGETVTWSIVSSVPSDIADAQAFRVTDALDTALDFVPNTVKVEGLNSASATSGTEIAGAGNWVASLSSPNTLVVTFKDKNSASPNGLAELAKYKFVKITFDTTVNAEILDRTNQTVENTATVDFTNQFGQDKVRETPVTEIHSGIIKIDKTDANTGAKLAGAEFQIASSEENAKAGNYLKKIILDPEDPTSVKIVDVGEAGYDTADAWVETTDANGSASFAGLKDYAEDANGNKTYLSYWLVETQAPNGYNLLTAPVQVDFTAENSTVATSYTVTQAVKNITGFTLPVTGGIGTILFTIAGVALIGLAIVLLKNSRKKKMNSNS